MLEYEGKPLEVLSLEDTIEFEKVVLKRLRGAGMMSEHVQNQLQMYVDEIRIHKSEKIAELQFDNATTKQKVETTLNIGDIDGEFDEDEQ
jgi:tellurite resistance protein